MTVSPTARWLKQQQDTLMQAYANSGLLSRRRDLSFDGTPPVHFIRCFNSDKQGGCRAAGVLACPVLLARPCTSVPLSGG